MWLWKFDSPLDIVVISLPDNNNIIMHFQALLSKLVSCTSLWSQYLSLWYCNSRLTLMGSSEKCSQSKSAFFTSLNWPPWFSISNLSSQGSVVVFGAYSTWTYEEAVDETFCDYTCFMFAFVLLILRWVKRHLSAKPSSSWLPLFSRSQCLSPSAVAAWSWCAKAAPKAPRPAKMEILEPCSVQQQKEDFQDHPRMVLLKLWANAL